MKSSTAFEPIFVDTWGWITLASQRDVAFAPVADLRRRYTGRRGGWVTSDYVLDETITHLFATVPFPTAVTFLEGIFESQCAGLVTIEPVTPERFEAAWKLRLRYRDKPRISFTDLTSFLLMRELGIRHVITGDAHFEQAQLGFRRLP